VNVVTVQVEGTDWTDINLFGPASSKYSSVIGNVNNYYDNSSGTPVSIPLSGFNFTYAGSTIASDPSQNYLLFANPGFNNSEASTVNVSWTLVITALDNAINSPLQVTSAIKGNKSLRAVEKEFEMREVRYQQQMNQLMNSVKQMMLKAGLPMAGTQPPGGPIISDGSASSSSCKPRSVVPDVEETSKAVKAAIYNAAAVKRNFKSSAWQGLNIEYERASMAESPDPVIVTPPHSPEEANAVCQKSDETGGGFNVGFKAPSTEKVQKKEGFKLSASK
jgi:hypothetical protein